MEIALVIAILQTVLAATWRLATPLIYTSLGELFTERSGVLNIGLEGIMLFGAFAGFAAGTYAGTPTVGLIVAIIVGLLVGLLFAFFTVTIKANQIVVGAAINMIGLGMTGFLYRTMFDVSTKGVKTFPPIKIPLLSQIPVVGEVLFQHSILVYATLIVVPLAAFLLYRTGFGLAVRSVGEHPKAADTVGISVTRVRYACCMLGGALAGVGGAFLTLSHTNLFIEGLVAGRGFIALAVVVFGRWKPWGVFGASLLFGVFYALQLSLQAMTRTVIPYQFWQALPYVATLVVLVALRGRAGRTACAGRALQREVIMDEPLLRIDNIVKSFGKVVANKGVSLDVRPGEIHCLLGENGAGKTVLMSILYGMYQPDSGSITYKGKPLTIHSPKDAIHHRIGMVHQHFMLVPTLTVAENIVLGQYKPWAVLSNMDQVAKRIRELGSELGFEVDPDALVENLSVGEQQRVEILKTMYHGADLLILDEPTAVLTPQETVQLLRLLRGLADRGLTVIFITHKLDEVMQVSDRVTVLRDGRVIDTVNTADTNPRALARMMVGRDVLMELPRPAYQPGAPLIEVEGVSVMNERGIEVVTNLTLAVHEREILGIAGVSGNGQTELALALAGLLPTCCGVIKLNGKVVDKLTPHDLGHQGMAHLPEDRIKMGIVLPFSVAENLILHEYNHAPYARGGFLAFGAIAQHARDLVEKFDVRTASVDTEIANLSGGNQQKVVVARELNRDPRVMLVNQPTRGIDIGATEFVLQQILAQRDRGSAILLISTELEELLAISDRILVMYEGQIVGEVPPDRSLIEEIGLMMAGKRSERMANERIANRANQRISESQRTAMTKNHEYASRNTQYGRPPMTKHPTLFITHRGERHQQAALAAAPAELEITMVRTPSKEQILALLPGKEFLITERTGEIDADIIRAGKDLRMIQRLGSQTYDIDLAAARAAGVPVCYLPVLSCIRVAEHMMLQMLACAKKLRESMDVTLSAADYGQPPKRCDEDYFAYNWSGRQDIRGLWGVTVGILGFGEIGTELARRLQGFGCKILYNKRNPLPAEAERELNIRFASADELVAQSDYVCMLMPLFPETEQTLGREFFARMKPGAIFVSCGGSGVVVDEALAEACASGHLYGAGVDTFTFEPIAPDSPLLPVARQPAGQPGADAAHGRRRRGRQRRRAERGLR